MVDIKPYKTSIGTYADLSPDAQVALLTDTTPLNPATRGVVEAVSNMLLANPKRHSVKHIAAAVLRAAADQLVPSPGTSEIFAARGPDLERLAQRQHTRVQILAIANELDP